MTTNAKLHPEVQKMLNTMKTLTAEAKAAMDLVTVDKQTGNTSTTLIELTNVRPNPSGTTTRTRQRRRRGTGP